MPCPRRKYFTRLKLGCLIGQMIPSGVFIPCSLRGGDLLLINEKKVSPGRAWGFCFGAAQSGLSVSLWLGCPPPLRMPQHVSKQSALSSLLGRSTASCITAPQSGGSAFKPSIDAIPLRVLGGSPFESRRWTGGIDPRICQTFAASPAEPGELPFWFSTPRIFERAVMFPTPLHCHHGVDVGLSFRSDDRRIGGASMTVSSRRDDPSKRAFSSIDNDR